MFLTEAEYDKYGLTADKVFWIFVICSLLGWIVEMIFCRIMHGYWENRQGLLYGPFTPIYGIGAALIFLAFYNIRHHSVIVVFFAGFFGGGLFEALCGWIQQAAFGTISWDYSSKWGSLLGGRTSIPMMVLWGIACVVFLHMLYPPLSWFIETFETKTFGNVITLLVLVFMVVNITLSVSAVARQYTRSEGVPARNVYEKFLDKRYPDERLAKVYTNMRKVENDKRPLFGW